METKEEKYCLKHEEKYAVNEEKYAVIYALNDYSGIVKDWTITGKGLDLKSAQGEALQCGLTNQHGPKRIVKLIKESELNNYNILNN